MCVKKSLQTLLSTLAVMVVAAALVVGCGSGSGNPANSGDSDARLILEDGYAWVYQVENGFMGVTQAGYIFNKDNTGFYIWSLGVWFKRELEWSVDGNKLYIPNGWFIDCDNDGCDTTVIFMEFTYSFSGDTLILSDDEDTVELVKTWVGEDIGENGEFDPALANTVWIYENPITGGTARWVFMADEDGQLSAVYMSVDADDELIDMGMYLCSTSDGMLNLTAIFGGQNAAYAYSISGNELTVNGVTYLKTDESYDYLAKTLSKKALKVKLSKRLGLLK